jgi:hypothetical protein
VGLSGVLSGGAEKRPAASRVKQSSNRGINRYCSLVARVLNAAAQKRRGRCWNATVRGALGVGFFLGGLLKLKDLLGSNGNSAFRFEGAWATTALPVVSVAQRLCNFGFVIVRKQARKEAA